MEETIAWIVSMVAQGGYDASANHVTFVSRIGTWLFVVLLFTRFGRWCDG
jgi:hypothetical protein